MSNHVRHQRKGGRKTEIRPASSCSGEGHNGAIGRSVWKKLSRRSERRNADSRKLAGVHKRKGKPIGDPNV